MKTVSLTGLILLLSLPLYGDFTITDEQTTTQTLTGVDGVGTITNTGSVITTGNAQDAVTTNTDTGQTLINEGQIQTSGNSADGMLSQGDLVTMTNNGEITTFSTFAYGMRALGDSATVTNTGSIRSYGDDADLIRTAGTDTAVVNSGVLVANFDNAFGVFAQGDRTTVTNSGTISTTGEFTSAVQMTSGGTVDDSTLIHTGTITVNGLEGAGFFSNGSRNTYRGNGTITIIGDTGFAIDSTGASFFTATVDGAISITGDDGTGIRTLGTDAAITLNSTVLITGDNGVVVDARGDRSTITNTGTITTDGSGTDGIFNNGGDNTIILNSGTLLTNQTNSEAIRSTGDSARITNNGQLTTLGTGSEGILTTGNTNILVNGGTISTSGVNSEGISASGTNDTIINTGQIITLATGSRGILASGNNASVTNNGTIRSVVANAISMTGNNPQLSLQLNSNVQGTVHSTNALNLNVQRGLNLRFTIDDASNGFATLNVDAPYVTVGNTETIAVIDPTGLAIQPRLLEDLTDAIFNTIYLNQMDWMNCSPSCANLWFQGIGSDRKSRDDIPYLNDQWGLLAGGTWGFKTGGHLGLFAGASLETGNVENSTQSANVNNYLGGITYEKPIGCLYFAGALSSGYVGWSNKRRIMNNLAPNGIETAKADFSGAFLGLDLSGSWLGGVIGDRLRPYLDLSLRYGGFFLGDYTENGSSANLSVHNRRVSLIKVRGEFALQCARSHWFSLAPYLATAGRFQVAGNRVTSELLGQPLNFETGATESIAEGMLGLRAALTLERFQAFFNVEGLRDQTNSSRFLGSGGVRCTF